MTKPHPGTRASESHFVSYSWVSFLIICSCLRFPKLGVYLPVFWDLPWWGGGICLLSTDWSFHWSDPPGETPAESLVWSPQPACLSPPPSPRPGVPAGPARQVLAPPHQPGWGLDLTESKPIGDVTSQSIIIISHLASELDWSFTVRALG